MLDRIARAISLLALATLVAGAAHAARGVITLINPPEKHGKIERTDDASGDTYEFVVPVPQPLPDLHIGDPVTFTSGPGNKAEDVRAVDDPRTLNGSSVGGAFLSPRGDARITWPSLPEFALTIRAGSAASGIRARACWSIASPAAIWSPMGPRSEARPRQGESRRGPSPLSPRRS